MTPDSKRPIDWYDIAIDALTEDEAKSLLRLLYSTNISMQSLLRGTEMKRWNRSIAPPTSEAEAELGALVGEGRAIG